MTDLDRYWPVHYTAEYAHPCLTCTRPECDYGPGCPWHRNSDSIHPMTAKQRAAYLATVRNYNHTHHDKINARERAYRETHREEYNAYQRAYQRARRAAVGAGPRACPPPEEPDL
jgi:hypothetical protein